MKKYILFIAICLLCIDCSGQQQKQLIIKGKQISPIESLVNRSFWGVEMKDNVYTVVDHCAGGYPTLRFYKDRMYYYAPQEGYYYIIKEIKLISPNKYEIKTSGSYTEDDSIFIIYKNCTSYLEKKNELLWKYIDMYGQDYLLTDSINVINKKVAYYEQPCEECDNCPDDSTDVSQDNVAENNIISIFSIFEANIRWRNHCNGVNKDDIIFYGPTEISFGISSLNFICRATSKQIDETTIELYLVDDGNWYAPDGEVYSNNNVPKGIKFKNCSLKIPVARVKAISEYEVEFTWLGFYNKITKKREFLQNPFDKTKNPVILKKCGDK